MSTPEDKIVVPSDAYRGEEVADTDSGEVERLMRLGEAGKLSLEDVQWLKQNAKFPHEAFQTVAGGAPSWSRAGQAFKLVPVKPKNYFEEWSKEMEQDH